MKRVLLIAFIVILIGVGLYLGRSFIFKSNEPALPEPLVETQTPASDLTTTPAEEDAPDAITLVADVPMADYWVDPVDRSVYLISLGGSLYRVRAGGEPEKLYSTGSQAVSQVLPAPRGNKALVESGYPRNPFFRLVDANGAGAKFLPLGTVAAAWSPDASEIALLKNQALSIMNVASGKIRFVSDMNMTDVLLEWKTPKEIYVGSRPSAGVYGQWWSYNLSKKTFLPLMPELPGLTLQWGSDGQTGLQFTNITDGQDNTLSIFQRGGSALSLNINTLPEKCTAPADVIYCGEFTGINTKTLPDAYYQSYFGPDRIVRVSSRGESAKKVLLFSDDTTLQINVYHPTIVGPSLYFINRNDNKLYSLSL